MQSSEAIGTARDDAEPAENLGVRLRQAREAQGLSLEAVSTELRISVTALKALEECRFDTLGPPVFAKGYLRQYGSRLGLDVPGLVADYQRMAGDTSVEIAPSRTIRLRDERQIMVWIGAVIALLLAAAVLAVWWWLGRAGTVDIASEAATEARAAIPAAGREPAGAAAGRSVSPPAGAAAEPTGAAVRQADAAVRQAEPAERQAEAAAPPAAAAPEPDVSPAPAAFGEPAAATDQQAPEPYAGPTLEVFFVEDSWADITDADGQRLYYALGLAGTTANLPADRDLNLFFGNAAGVELRLDGEPFPIPVSARRGDLAQFDLEARTGQAP